MLRRAFKIPLAMSRVPRAFLSSGHHSHDGGDHAHGHHAPKPMSFIDKVKAAGANAMLGVFTNTGDRFDRVLSDLNVKRVGSGSVTCELTVVPSLQNTYGTLHGGEVVAVTFSGATRHFREVPCCRRNLHDH